MNLQVKLNDMIHTVGDIEVNDEIREALEVFKTKVNEQLILTEEGSLDVVEAFFNGDSVGEIAEYYGVSTLSIECALRSKTRRFFQQR